MKIWQNILIGIFIGLILSAAILLVALPPRGAPVVLLPVPTPAPISVDVSGAVLHPGLYHLPQGSRLEAAVQAAGGFQDDANRQMLNLAARLQDGEKIHVQVVGETVQAAPTIPPSTRSGIDGIALPGTLVNLNTATSEELQTLPGIGEVRAKDIIAYRESHAGFKSIEEIQEVPGIGPVMFERLKDQITIE
jgi:competence protein ComEA